MMSHVLAFAFLATAAPGSDKSQEISAVKKELGELTSLVGKWHGTATPQDSASKRKREFWREKGDCQWSFSKDKSGLVLNLKDSKQVQSATLTRSQDKEKPVRIHLILADKREPVLLGKVEDNKLTAEGKVENGDEFKMTVKLVSADRFAYWLASRKSGKDRYQPIVESSHQREGVAFAAAKTTGPECIVTGGLANIQVTYKGKTYFVCCNGCKEAFDAEPEKYIAEAASKRKSKK